MANQHHHTDLLEPEVRYVPAPPVRQRRPSVLGGIFARLFEMVLRMVVFAVVAVLLLAAVFVGGMALLSKGVDMIPTTTTTTTP